MMHMVVRISILKQRSSNVNNGTVEASFSNAASLDTVMEKSSTSKIVGVQSYEGLRYEGNLEDVEVGSTHFLAHTNNVLFPVTKECKASVWGSSDDSKRPRPKRTTSCPPARTQ